MNALIVAPVAVPTAFDTWMAGFSLSGTNAAAGFDYDHDGVNNLLEYAQNGNPTNPADVGVFPALGATVMQDGTNWIEYVYVERATTNHGLTYEIVTADNLTNRTFAPSTDAVFAGEGQAGDYKTVTNLIPTDGKSAEFLRVEVEEK
jgi:hypothetical protein